MQYIPDVERVQKKRPASLADKFIVIIPSSQDRRAELLQLTVLLQGGSPRSRSLPP